MNSSDALVSTIFIKEGQLQNIMNSYPAEVIKPLRPPKVNFLNSILNTGDVDDSEEELSTAEYINEYSFDLGVEFD